jgi:hypothetical protein
MAEDDREPLGAAPAQFLADEARVLDRDAGVLDEGLAAVEDRVAGDAQFERAVVDPVRGLGEALALDPAVVEGQNTRARLEHAQVVGHREAAPSSSRRPG